jgi:hypothetical protein
MYAISVRWRTASRGVGPRRRTTRSGSSTASVRIVDCDEVSELLMARVYHSTALSDRSGGNSGAGRATRPAPFAVPVQVT